jgi:hypothetical protein
MTWRRGKKKTTMTRRRRIHLVVQEIHHVMFLLLCNVLEAIFQYIYNKNSKNNKTKIVVSEFLVAFCTIIINQ